MVRSDAQAIEALLRDFRALISYHPRWYLRANSRSCHVVHCSRNWVNVALPLTVCCVRRISTLSQHSQVQEFYATTVRRVAKSISLYQRSRSTDWRTNQYRQRQHRPLDCRHFLLNAGFHRDDRCTSTRCSPVCRSRCRSSNQHIDRQDQSVFSDNVADQYCTIASNAKGGDDIVTLIKCIGQLVLIKFHCLSSPLFQGLEQQITTAKKAIKWCVSRQHCESSRRASMSSPIEYQAQNKQQVKCNKIALLVFANQYPEADT